MLPRGTGQRKKSNNLCRVPNCQCGLLDFYGTTLGPTANCGISALNLGSVWYSSQQLHKLLWAVFLPNTYFQNSFMGEVDFSLSTMHEVVCEAILPSTFSKTAQLHQENHSWSYFLRKTALLVKLSCAKQALHPTYVFVRAEEKQLHPWSCFGNKCLAKKQLTTAHEAVVSCIK